MVDAKGFVAQIGCGIHVANPVSYQKVMSNWSPTKYKNTNWSSYNDSLKRRGSLSIWFDPEMTWVPPPSGKPGRQQSFSDEAIQTVPDFEGAICGRQLVSCKACYDWSGWTGQYLISAPFVAVRKR